MLNPVSPILEGLRLSIVEHHNLLAPVVSQPGGWVSWHPWYLAYSGVWAVAGIVLLIGWLVFGQAARRSLGLKGVLLTLALFAALVWLLAEWRVLSLGTTRAVGHVVLVVVALLLAVGMSWSHVTRRLTGQVDTDEVA